MMAVPAFTSFMAHAQPFRLPASKTISASRRIFDSSNPTKT